MDNISDSIVSAIFSNYILIYEIDIKKDYIKLVYKEDEEGSFGMEEEAVYSEFNIKYARERIDKEYARERERRGTLENLKQELKDKISFELSYTNNYGKARTVEYRRISLDAKGIPDRVMLAYKRLEDDRAETFKLRLERQKHRDFLERELSEAKEASLAKTKFLSNMSHDLRTPLSSMMGYINLAKSHIDNKDLVEDYLSKINNNCEQLLATINDVLDISRIEGGRVSVEEYQQNLSEIIDEVKNTIMPLAKAKEQEFNINMEVSDEEILADKSKLVRILTNILNNAVKYTHRCGQVDFTIQDRHKTIDGYIALRFIIKDNGVGISSEFLEHIFEPFERENDREIAKIQGTGLGLSIAKELTKMLNGDLTIESKKFSGTKAIIDMDFKLFRQDIISNKLNLIATNNLRRAEDIANQRTFEKKKFLIVDDNEANLEILSTFLEDLGANTDSATNGYDALNILKESKLYQYNAVLMDIKMPLMNGDETTREIRKLENRTIAAVPIVGISANVYSSDKIRAMNAGMDAYIAKPVDTTELIRILKEVML